MLLRAGRVFHTRSNDTAPESLHILAFSEYVLVTVFSIAHLECYYNYCKWSQVYSLVWHLSQFEALSLCSLSRVFHREDPFPTSATVTVRTAPPT